MPRRRRKTTEQTPRDYTFPEPQMASIETTRDSLTGPPVPDSLTPEEDATTNNKEWAFLVELDAAIKNHKVDLSHIVLARYLSPRNPMTGVSIEAYPGYTDRFEALQAIYFETWTIVDRHYCTYIPAAVALRLDNSERERVEIEFVYYPEATKTTSPEIEAAVWRARSYYLNASQCKSARYKYIVRDIYFLIVELLNLADAEAIPGHDRERTRQALPKINDELRQVRTSIERALEIEARHNYLAGMSVGVTVLLIAVVAIEQAIDHLTRVRHIDTVALGTVAAGGIGAVLSVLTRLTANKLNADPTAGSWLVRLAGFFRPVIGGVFGIAIYIFVQSGILPIKVTATGLNATYFFLGIAFLAGFSERLAQDAVTRAGSVISDTGPLERPDNSAKTSKP